jgi:hypothetical protein
VVETKAQTASAPMVFVFDCDNTLLRNDDVKDAMDRALISLVGPNLTQTFWRVYEDVRGREGTVDLPTTFTEFRPYLASDAQLEAARSAIMGFPFQDYLYPDALETIATVKQHGLPVIVSDGDSVYQPHKIARSGLASAVNEQWVVYLHKEQHLAEIEARWPAPLYVMIDDKARLLAALKSQAPDRVVTVHIDQGHYAAEVASPEPDISLKHIGDLRSLDFAALSRFTHA